jgi:hypothetical protein
MQDNLFKINHDRLLKLNEPFLFSIIEDVKISLFTLNRIIANYKKQFREFSRKDMLLISLKDIDNSNNNYSTYALKNIIRNAKDIDSFISALKVLNRFNRLEYLKLLELMFKEYF